MTRELFNMNRRGKREIWEELRIKRHYINIRRREKEEILKDIGLKRETAYQNEQER